MKKIGEKQLSRILGKNQVPEVDKQRLDRLKTLVRYEAERAGGIGMEEKGFLHRILRQIPYITKWVWLVQALTVVLFVLAAGQDPRNLKMIMVLSLAGPVLALLPGADMIRSYGYNMWEMEAACRYDLRQIMAMRMCIVGGTDLAVLAAGCLAYGKGQGSVWEFGLFVLLPFLLSSSVYLWEINHFAGNCSSLLLAATGAALICVGVPVLLHIHDKMVRDILKWAPVFTGWALAAGCILTIYSGIRLWSSLQENRGERKTNAE